MHKWRRWYLKCCLLFFFSLLISLFDLKLCFSESAAHFFIFFFYLKLLFFYLSCFGAEGEIQGTVHRRLLEERSEDLKAGVVLLLKQVRLTRKCFMCST